MGYPDFIIAAVIVFAVGFMGYMLRRWRAEDARAQERALARIGILARQIASDQLVKSMMARIVGRA